MLTDAELESMALQQEAPQAIENEPDSFEPQKTMIRSLDELYQQKKEVVNKFFQLSPIDEPFQGWAPDIQILNEGDLKKIEKQEERQ